MRILRGHVPSLMVLVITIGMILNFSTHNGSQSSIESNFLTTYIQRVVVSIKGELERDDLQVELIVRKFAHFLEYYTLGIVVVVFFRGILKKAYLWIPISIIFSALVPIIDEFYIQTRSIGRTPMVLDVMIDLLGLIIAILTYTIITFMQKYEQKKSSKNSAKGLT